MPYADYTFYTQSYGGALLGEAEFSRLAWRAGCYIDNITRGRVREEDDNIRRAACAVAEAMREQERGGAVASETVGRHTVQYAGGRGTPGGRLYAAAALYLYGTGLLYSGF